MAAFRILLRFRGVSIPRNQASDPSMVRRGSTVRVRQKMQPRLHAVGTSSVTPVEAGGLRQHKQGPLRRGCLQARRRT
jgi:hypothetical protein